MISVTEARARILDGISPVGSEIVGLTDAFARVTAEPLTSRRTQPPMAVSAMDGYAVRAVDIATAPVDLTVVTEIAAGAAYDGTIDAGCCARIFTGAPLPAGADTIVIQEDTEADEPAGRVRILKSASKGAYVRPAGLDFSEGEVLIPPGTVMTARTIGLAAAMNLPWVQVRRKPRVAILSTGDEIVLPGQDIGPNQIVSSNGPALAAAVAASGGVPTLLPIAPDDADSLKNLALGAIGHDLLLTTGGASVGKHDLVGSVLKEVGLELDFWKIAMRPGKPLMFGSLAGVPMLGLPGNPVSALVCFLLYAGPAIAKLMGMKNPDPEMESARLTEGLPENDQREDYLRATLTRESDGTLLATPFSRQDSSMMRRLTDADCLIRRMPHAAPADAGETVEIIRFAGGLRTY